MSSWLEKWRGDEVGQSLERQRMQQALARLETVSLSRTVNREPAASLAFILDLTASRDETLPLAREATTGMFGAVKEIGEIAVKMFYFRGYNECKAGRWEDDPEVVSRSMQRLSCSGGNTQIVRALNSVLADARKPSAVVYIGDHCEDDPTKITALALEFGERRIPVFVFHECRDGDRKCQKAQPTFRRLAELSGGAYSEFRLDSGDAMRELLANVAAFSAAGAEGLKQVPAPQTSAGRQLQERLLLLAPPKTIDDSKKSR